MSDNTVVVKRELLVWAQRRASVEPGILKKKFPSLNQWEEGTKLPTLHQLEDFARTVHIPIGYLFLPGPIEEPLPIPDFRTVGDRGVERPSPDLLDTIYLCQQRQEWYQEFAKIHGQERVLWIGAADVSDDPIQAARVLWSHLGVTSSHREGPSSWTEALRFWISHAEAAGVLVMSSSIVGTNGHRHLKVQEFRGFALVDPWAPLVFLNAGDSKAAQLFTLTHELAHLFLGQGGLFDTEAGRVPDQHVERWCNQVAAELLMPLEETRTAYQPQVNLSEEIQRLARVFKVSTLVALRRLADAGFVNEETLWSTYTQEDERLRSLERKEPGGDFYNTLGARNGKRFARAIIASTLEGQTLFQDAFHLLGIRHSEVFYKAARELDVLS